MTGGPRAICHPAPRRARVYLVAFLLAAAGCAARAFAPATAEDAARALAAWSTALERSATIARDGNLLYDARFSQGLASASGTLAVKLRGDTVEASLSGSFGATLATYSDGVLRGDKLRPVALSSRELRALLAGSWPVPSPEVAGKRGAEVLLRWRGAENAEAVFDVARAETSELTIARSDGEISARFSGARSPWPENLEIQERRTKSKITLKLVAWEPAA